MGDITNQDFLEQLSSFFELTREKGSVWITLKQVIPITCIGWRSSVVYPAISKPHLSIQEKQSRRFDGFRKKFPNVKRFQVKIFLEEKSKISPIPPSVSTLNKLDFTQNGDIQKIAMDIYRYGKELLRQRRFDTSQTMFDILLTMLVHLPQEFPSRNNYLQLRTEVYHYLGLCMIYQQKWLDAKSSFLQALDVLSNCFSSTNTSLIPFFESKFSSSSSISSDCSTFSVPLVTARLHTNLGLTETKLDDVMQAIYHMETVVRLYRDMLAAQLSRTVESSEGGEFDNKDKDLFATQMSLASALKSLARARVELFRKSFAPVVSQHQLVNTSLVRVLVMPNRVAVLSEELCLKISSSNSSLSRALSECREARLVLSGLVGAGSAGERQLEELEGLALSLREELLLQHGCPSLSSPSSDPATAAEGDDLDRPETEEAAQDVMILPDGDLLAGQAGEGEGLIQQQPFNEEFLELDHLTSGSSKAEETEAPDLSIVHQEAPTELTSSDVSSDPHAMTLKNHLEEDTATERGGLFDTESIGVDVQVAAETATVTAPSLSLSAASEGAGGRELAIAEEGESLCRGSLNLTSEAEIEDGSVEVLPASDPEPQDQGSQPILESAVAAVHSRLAEDATLDEVPLRISGTDVEPAVVETLSEGEAPALVGFEKATHAASSSPSPLNASALVDLVSKALAATVTATTAFTISTMLKMQSLQSKDGSSPLPVATSTSESCDCSHSEEPTVCPQQQQQVGERTRQLEGSPNQQAQFLVVAWMTIAVVSLVFSAISSIFTRAKSWWLERQEQRLEYLFVTTERRVLQFLQESRYQEAKGILEEVITVMKRRRGSAHPDTGHLLYYLARTQFHLNALDAAEQSFQQVLDIFCVFGEDVHTARAREGLADVLIKLERPREAEKHLVTALEIYSREGDRRDIDSQEKCEEYRQRLISRAAYSAMALQNNVLDACTSVTSTTDDGLNSSLSTIGLSESRTVMTPDANSVSSLTHEVSTPINHTYTVDMARVHFSLGQSLFSRSLYRNALAEYQTALHILNSVKDSCSEESQSSAIQSDLNAVQAEIKATINRISDDTDQARAIATNATESSAFKIRGRVSPTSVTLEDSNSSPSTVPCTPPTVNNSFNSVDALLEDYLNSW